MPSASWFAVNTEIRLFRRRLNVTKVILGELPYTVDRKTPGSQSTDLEVLEISGGRKVLHI